MQETKELAMKWLSVSQEFQVVLEQEKTQSILRDLLKSVNDFPFIYDPHIKGLLESYAEEDDGELSDYVRQHNKTFWLNTNMARTELRHVIELMITRNGSNQMLDTLQIIDYMARGWRTVLEPMKLNLFYGFPNETMLIKFIENRTSGDQRQKPLLSAIVFDNMRKDGRLPKHIFYRIRMDGRFFFSTQSVRSRYWYPGALVGNSKYFYYGFVWMQDQLERAMIDILTGRNITNPGVYVQEMPYPCYLKDE